MLRFPVRYTLFAVLIIGFSSLETQPPIWTSVQQEQPPIWTSLPDNQPPIWTAQPSV